MHIIRLILSTYRRIVAAAGIALSLLAAAGPSFAQVQVPPFNATTRNPANRVFSDQQVTTIRTTLAFNMCTAVANVCTVRLANGSLPYNALVLRVTLFTYVAFNSTTSDAFTLGVTQANANELSTTGMTPRTLGSSAATVVATANNVTGNGVAATGAAGGFDLWLKWTAGTGNTATAGLASLVIEYVASNDGLCAPVPLGATPAGC